MNEFIGLLIVSIGVMLGSFLPLIQALLKLNTTLNKLGHLIDVQQTQIGSVIGEVKELRTDFDDLERDYTKHIYTKHKVDNEGTE